MYNQTSELRDDILTLCDSEKMAHLVDVLIATVDADALKRGVAEGEEQERGRIRKAGNKAAVLHDGTLFVDEDLRKKYAGRHGDVFIIPASAFVSLDETKKEEQ